MSPPSDPGRPGDVLADVLAAGGAPATLAPAVTAALGATAADQLAEDPWRLLAVPGVRPDQADSYARSRLRSAAGPDDPRRARAIVTWLLERAARDGHSAVPAMTVFRALPAFGFADAEAALAAVVADGAVLALDGVETGGASGEGSGGGSAAGAVLQQQLLLALDEWAMAEDSVAEGVQRLLATARHLAARDDVGAVVAGVEPGVADAVRAAAETGISVAVPETALATPALVGGLRRLAEACGCRLLVATATIRGARHLRDVTGTPVTTLHELAAGGSVTAGLVVVTEAALLDVAAAAALFGALDDGTHVVLAGDPSGLASPAPGLVLADLAESEAVPVTQASAAPGDGPGGVLSRLATGVRAGSLVPIDPSDREVVVVPARDAGEARHRALQLIADSIPRAIGIPAEETIVVTPRRSGMAGADAINTACKHRLNPGPGKFGGFDPGDRVVVTSGSFAGAPYGEIGTVLGGTDTSLDLDFGSHRYTASEDELRWLRLGWAVTARQAATASWPAVVAVFPGEAAGSLSRALVLTSVTAARAHLSVVHAAGPALAHAVARTPGRPRITHATRARQRSPGRPADPCGSAHNWAR